METKKIIDLGMSAIVIIALLIFTVYIALIDIYLRYRSALIGVLIFYIVWRIIRLYSTYQQYKRKSYEH